MSPVLPVRLGVICGVELKFALTLPIFTLHLNEVINNLFLCINCWLLRSSFLGSFFGCGIFTDKNAYLFWVSPLCGHHIIYIYIDQISL